MFLKIAMPLVCLLLSRTCYTRGFGFGAGLPVRFGVRLFSSTVEPEKAKISGNERLNKPIEKLLVHWRGEGDEGYSITFRHPEFLGALSAVTNQTFETGKPPIHFHNALKYDGEAFMHEKKLLAFNQSMQWISITDDDEAFDGFDRSDLTLIKFVAAASRCSLVHTLYEVVADGVSYEELNDRALENGKFQDVLRGGENESYSWAVRVRHFSAEAGTKSQNGGMRRSIDMEKEALLALKPMLLKFGGGVDLKKPDCKVYVFNGMKGKKVLARKIASGPQVRNFFFNRAAFLKCQNSNQNDKFLLSFGPDIQYRSGFTHLYNDDTIGANRIFCAMQHLWYRRKRSNIRSILWFLCHSVGSCYDIAFLSDSGDRYSTRRSY